MPSFPRAPFLATRALPSLRSGEVSLDEAEHFLHNREASVATLRKLFAFGPECRSRSLRNQRSPSPESSQLFARMETVLESYTDEHDANSLTSGYCPRQNVENVGARDYECGKRRQGNVRPCPDLPGFPAAPRGHRVSRRRTSMRYGIDAPFFVFCDELRIVGPDLRTTSMPCSSRWVCSGPRW